MSATVAGRPAGQETELLSLLAHDGTLDYPNTEAVAMQAANRAFTG